MQNDFLSFVKLLLLSMVLVFSYGSSLPKKVETELKMNQIQGIASHNSYKKAIDPPLLNMILSYDSSAIGLDYEHLALEQQLDLGLRGFELDVLYDPQGGRFAQPRGIELLRAQGVDLESIDTVALSKPGFKVLHVPDIDFRTHCGTFINCLSTMKKWSEAHADHLPIIITINPKTSGLEMPGFTEVLPFDAQVLAALDEEIVATLGLQKLITPHVVQGDFPSLSAAVKEKGWPLLKDARGKFLFVLDSGKEITEQYQSIQSSDRLMFVNVGPNHPQAAFFIMNNPAKQEEEIKTLVQQGFMVRTRADANTVEARTGDFSRFEAAIRSGAQVISTDYYIKSLSPQQDFEIVFENQAYTQCNPVLIKPKDCKLQLKD